MSYISNYPDTSRVKEFKSKILNDPYWTGNHKEDNEQTINKLIHAAVLDYIDGKIDLSTPKQDGRTTKQA